MKILSLPVTWAMAILTGLGLFAVLEYAYSDISKELAQKDQIERDILLTSIAQSVGNMTHELQKERGATSGFIASGGTAFAEILEDQRTKSDAAIADYLSAVGSLPAVSLSSSILPQLFAGVEAHLSGLQSLRGNVDQLTIDRRAAVQQITTLNRDAIALLAEIGKDISYSDAARAVQRHGILMTAKDVMGLERAVGAAAFAQAGANEGVIPPATLKVFNDLITQQDILISIYVAKASVELRSAMDALVASDATGTVARMRTVANSGVAAQTITIAPEQWFEAITQKIDLMKAAEDAGADEIGDFVMAAETRLDASLAQAIRHLAIVTVVLAFLSATLIYLTSKSLNRTANRVADLADGDIDSPVFQAPQRDLAKITGALAKFREAEVQRRANEELQRELEASSADGIRRISAGVAEGDFQDRLRMRDLQGASLILGEGINEILESAEGFVRAQKDQDNRLLAQKEAEREAQDRAVAALEAVVTAYSSGDFSKRMSSDGLDEVWLRVSGGINRIASMTEDALNDIRGIMTAVAEGSLDARMSSSHQGTFEEIAEATNASLDKLRDAFSSISDGAMQVGSATAELRVGSSDLTSRSDEQAETVAESAAATKQLSTTIEENSENLGRCNELMRALQSKTSEGQTVVKTAIDTMSSIEEASTEMEKIIGTIDEIAFQTNLLALNASVEAARAGEAGKGFAVVAAEVRGLANRCADASRQIGELIADSVGGVEKGATSVRETGQAISDVEETLKSVQSVIDDVLVAGEDQSKGVSTLASAVGRLDRMAQSNVELARSNMSLTETLSDQETRLSAAVGEYLRSSGQPSDGRKRGVA